MANLPNAKDKTMQKRWAQSEQEMGQGGASAASRGGTLVVCPTIALKQWQSELARFVKPGTLKVLIHHGAKRATLAEVRGSGRIGSDFVADLFLFYFFVWYSGRGFCHEGRLH